MSPSHRRQDLDGFVVGALYREDHSSETVEFVGTASMSELGGEEVGVFRFVHAESAYLVATNAGYQNGQTFTPLGDAVADDSQSDDELGGEA